MIVGWLSSYPDSSFDEEELKKVFRRAKENYEKWEKGKTKPLKSKKKK